jgi:pyruvate/2-oxoglutarate dehydrogenase complex dihydrolipoamide dehydrogenase (E3) component
MEEHAGQLLTEALAKDGVDVRTGAEVVQVQREGADGPVAVSTADGDGVVADELLVATGRRPHTTDIGVEAVGLEPGTALEVDATGLVRQVAGGWLYAAGDVTGQAPLTHMGKYSARATGDVIAVRARGGVADDGPWGRHATIAQERAVPQVVFTDPEVTLVGLTTAQARDAGVRVRCVDLDLAVAGSSLHSQDYTGWVRMVVDEDRRVVVGMTVVGQDTAELLHSATIAVVAEVPLERLWHAVPSFPTISEIWLRLLEGYGL